MSFSTRIVNVVCLLRSVTKFHQTNQEKLKNHHSIYDVHIIGIFTGKLINICRNSDAAKLDRNLERKHCSLWHLCACVCVFACRLSLIAAISISSCHWRNLVAWQFLPSRTEFELRYVAPKQRLRETRNQSIDRWLRKKTQWFRKKNIYFSNRTLGAAKNERRYQM